MAHTNLREEIFKSKKDRTGLYSFLLGVFLVLFIIITSSMGMGDQLALNAGYIH